MRSGPFSGFADSCSDSPHESAAFRIPDLLFVLFVSVLSIYVLLPFVNRYTEKDTAETGALVLSQVFSVFLFIYVSFVLFISLEYFLRSKTIIRLCWNLKSVLLILFELFYIYAYTRIYTHTVIQ